MRRGIRFRGSRSGGTWPADILHIEVQHDRRVESVSSRETKPSPEKQALNGLSGDLGLLEGKQKGGGDTTWPILVAPSATFWQM